MERILFCADLHGNLGQFDAVSSHALAEGIGHVVFGGDLTPNDAARRRRGRGGCRASGGYFDGWRETDAVVSTLNVLVHNDTMYRKCNTEAAWRNQQQSRRFG